MANFVDFHPIFKDFFNPLFSKINERRVFISCVGSGFFPKKNNRRATFIREIKVRDYDNYKKFVKKRNIHTALITNTKPLISEMSVL